MSNLILSCTIFHSIPFRCWNFPSAGDCNFLSAITVKTGWCGLSPHSGDNCGAWPDVAGMVCGMLGARLWRIWVTRIAGGTPFKLVSIRFKWFPIPQFVHTELVVLKIPRIQCCCCCSSIAWTHWNWWCCE